MRKCFFVSLLCLCFSLNAIANEGDIFQDSIRKIESIKILKVGNSYKACRFNIELPTGINRLQKYLAHIVFQSNKPTIEEGYNDFLDTHEAIQVSQDSIDMDSVKCEILFHPRFNGIFLSVDLAIPEYYKYGRSTRLRVVERNFIYDVDRVKTLLYNDIFSNDYIEPYIDKHFSEDNRINFIIRDGNYTYEDSIFSVKEVVWNYVLGDDYIEYAPYTHVGYILSRISPQKMMLVDCKAFLNPEFCNKIDWAKLGTQNDSSQNPVIKEQDQLKNKRASIMKKARVKMLELEKLEKKGKTYTPKLEYVYANDNKPFKDMHFFSPNNKDFYLSGLNKNVMEISSEELSELEVKKGLDYIIKEIRIIRDLIATQGETVYNYDAPQLNKRPIYSKGEEAFKKELGKALTTNKDWEEGGITVTVIVDKDGSILAPTIHSISSSNTKKISILKRLAVKLRKMKMEPGEVRGEKVRTLWSFTYLFSKSVTYERIKLWDVP